MHPGPHFFPLNSIAEMQTTEAASQTCGLQPRVSLMWAAPVTVAVAEKVRNSPRFLSDQRLSRVWALVMDLLIPLDLVRSSSSMELVLNPAQVTLAVNGRNLLQTAETCAATLHL